MQETGRRFLFLVASTREPGVQGNTEWLARAAAQRLTSDDAQTWLHLAWLQLPPFADLRHSRGEYPPPQGDLQRLLEHTMAATDLVFVSPVYWYSIPAPLKLFLDHWSAFLRVPSVPFKAAMAAKTLRLVTTSGDRAKAQPMIDSVRLCAEFLGMRWHGALWARGGAPGTTAQDAAAAAQAAEFLA